MKNILINKMPETVTVDGKEYDINYDFRSCLKIMIAYEDKELTDYEKILVALSLFYKDIPENTEEAVKEMINFLNMGEKIGTNISEARSYSIQKDAQYIYSGIQKTHNIDLSTTDMHFWRFMNLFIELDEDCFFNQLIYLRKQKRKGKLTEHEKELYYSLGEVVELEDDLSIEDREKLDKFYNLLG